MLTQLMLPLGIPRAEDRFSDTCVSPLSLDSLIEETLRLARCIHATRTINGYTSDWRLFVTWCEQNVRSAFPATSETVALYVTDFLCRGRRIKTMRRHLCAIMYHHREAGYSNP